MKNNNRKTIVLASDHGGFALKEKLKKFLLSKKISIVDAGTFKEESCDYPEYAYRAACLVARKKAGLGILICKTGIGNAICANKVKGIRAALCYNVKAARLSRLHNDANILVLGSLFVNENLAKKITQVFLKTDFEGGRHRRRLRKIERIDAQCRGLEI